MKKLMIRSHKFTMLASRLVAIVLFAALLSAAPFHAALAQTAPDLGSAVDFAVLGGTAVTLTNSAVIGDVGSPTAVTVTGGTVDGTVYPAADPIAIAAYDDFLLAYDALAPSTPPTDEQWPCTGALNTAYTDATLTLLPGVYCNSAAVTFTRTTLTLDAQNNPNAVWIFKIGTLGTGALTGTSFKVVMANGGSPCNVYWWVAGAATLTDSNFVGTILAGAAITTTRGTFNGQALAQAAVTITGTAVAVCSSPGLPPIPPLDEGACKKCKACSDYWNNYWNNYWKNNCQECCKDHGKDNCWNCWDDDRNCGRDCGRDDDHNGNGTGNRSNHR